MAWSNRLESFTGGRKVLMAVGGLYVAFALLCPFLPGVDTSPGTDAVVGLLAGGSGVILLYTGHRLPRTTVHSEFYPVITTWALGGIAAMLSLLGLVAVAAGLQSPVPNILILTAIGSVSGLVAGTYDARARTRTRVLEERNRELHQTHAELHETVTRLEESEQRYRTLTENFPNGAVALLDDELRHTLIAGQGFDQIELSADELRNRRISDVYPERLVATVEPHYRAALDGESSSFEVDIDDRTFEFRTHPLTRDDDVYAVLAMSQDITERKQRERELLNRARQQQVVADLGQFALETDDLDDLMREAGRQVADVLDTEYCKVLDLDEESEELLLRQGVGWNGGLVGEETISAVESDSQAAYTLANDNPIVVENLASETRFSGPDLLRAHDVRSGISTVIGPFDEPWGILGVHDTDHRTFSDDNVSFVQSVANVLAEAIERHQYQSELEQVIENLEESNKRLEQFAYAASHDLQEPLRMVSSYLRLVDRRYGDEFDEEGEEFLGFAIDGADRMRSMIDGLLKYSRVETKGAPLESVDLGNVLEKTRADLQVKIQDTDATITSDPLPRVSGDGNQLRQVFQNLLENAIKYSGDDPPHVHVTAERADEMWRVSVRDRGIGIDPDDQDRIFEVFQRVHSHYDFHGTGIGLALCERIIERHGGDIWVESEPGEETVFSFTLSALPAQDERPKRARSD